MTVGVVAARIWSHLSGGMMIVDVELGSGGTWSEPAKSSNDSSRGAPVGPHIRVSVVELGCCQRWSEADMSGCASSRGRPFQPTRAAAPDCRFVSFARMVESQRRMWNSCAGVVLEPIGGVGLAGPYFTAENCGQAAPLFCGFFSMSAESDQHLTGLLQAAQAGDAAAGERLLAAVYEQLH